MEAKLFIDEEFVIPTSIVEQQDLATELWLQYFTPPEPLSATEKRHLRDKYNMIAKEVNKAAGNSVLVIITPSTIWVPKKDEQGNVVPLSNGKLASSTIKQLASNAKNTPAPATTAAPKVVREPGTGGIIEQIIAHHKAGMANKDIIALGFNKSTVARQVSEYKKRVQDGTEK